MWLVVLVWLVGFTLYLMDVRLLWLLFVVWALGTLRLVINEFRG